MERYEVWERRDEPVAVGTITFHQAVLVERGLDDRLEKTRALGQSYHQDVIEETREARQVLEPALEAALGAVGMTRHAGDNLIEAKWPAGNVELGTVPLLAAWAIRLAIDSVASLEFDRPRVASVEEFKGLAELSRRLDKVFDRDLDRE